MVFKNVSIPHLFSSHNEKFLNILCYHGLCALPQFLAIQFHAHFLFCKITVTFIDYIKKCWNTKIPPVFYFLNYHYHLLTCILLISITLSLSYNTYPTSLTLPITINRPQKCKILFYITCIPSPTNYSSPTSITCRFSIESNIIIISTKSYSRYYHLNIHFLNHIHLFFVSYCSIKTSLPYLKILKYL